MRMPPRRSLVAVLTLPLLYWSPHASAQGSEVDVNLVLSVDVSRPMDRDEAEVARGGYVAAFRDPK
jgi:hypothetical protein